MFVTTCALWLLFVSPGADVCRSRLGHDFLAFYTAGTFVREGRAQELYDLDAVRTFQHATASKADLRLGDAVGPWWNPPVFALPFAPLAALPYQAALMSWIAINLLAVTFAFLLIARFPGPNVRNPLGIVVLLTLFSMPFLQALTHGQNACISLLLLACVATAWRSNRAVLAGATLGLLSYKPQLAAVIAAVMVIHLGWRAAAGLALSGIALFALTELAMPGSLGNYLNHLPANLHFMQVANAYPWERHVTLQAFWRLLFQGGTAGEMLPGVRILTTLTAMPFAAGLLIASIRARRTGDGATNPLIAAAVATMPLLMPFYFDYDLLLLAVPAVLLAHEWRDSRGDHWLFRGWVTLFLWLFINPHVADVMRFNLTVPLLAAVAGMLIVRSLRRESPAQVDNTMRRDGFIPPTVLPQAA